MSAVEKRSVARSALSGKIKTTVLEPNQPHFYASMLNQKVWFSSKDRAGHTVVKESARKK